MDEEQNLLATTIGYFGLIFVALFTSWIVLGPGGDWAFEISSLLQTTAQHVGDWYQQTLEGSAKLIAPVITIASGTYAIVKGYKHAEARLHVRLNDYLEREERRLSAARKQLRLIIERPGVRRDFREPIFLSPSLKGAVRELGFGSYFLPPQIDYASYQLSSAIDQLEKQVGLSARRQKSLDTQLATAHLLKGAMAVAAASKARQAGEDDRLLLTDALNHFRAALAINPDDHEALEYAGHVHVCLQQDSEAEPLLDRLLNLTASESKSLTRARALRYKSNVAVLRSRNGVAARNLKKALEVLPNLCGQDRIEEAEIHESLGDRQDAMGNHVQARSHWEIAAAIYKEVDCTVGVEGVEFKLRRLSESPDRDIDRDARLS
jgi:tetratricopeptide (TPR) repeat protein